MSELLLSINQCIDARFGDEQVFPVHFQHHKPILVQREQAPPLSLRLSPSVGVRYQVGSAQHDRPFFRPAHRATAPLTEGAAGVARIPDRFMPHSFVCEGLL